MQKEFLTSQTAVRKPVAVRANVTSPAQDQYIAVAVK